MLPAEMQIAHRFAFLDGFGNLSFKFFGKLLDCGDPLVLPFFFEWIAL